MRKIIGNYVLIRPHENHVRGSHGIEMADFVNPHLSLAVTGEVVSVCGPLQYFGKKLKKLQRRPTRYAGEVAKIRDYMAMSAIYDVPVEIKEGDTVLFPYIHQIQDAMTEEERVDGDLLLRYDSLTARVGKSGIYPLNGQLLARKIFPEQGVVAELRPFWDNVAEVVAEGCRVRDYVDYGCPDAKDRLLGRKVVVKQGMAVRIENAHHVFAASEMLWSFHRRDVLMYL